MPKEELLERRVAELQGSGVEGQEAAITIFREDYATPVKELAELLGLSNWDAGRSSPLARPRHRAQPAVEEKGKPPEPSVAEAKPERTPPPEPATAALSPSGKEFRRVAEQVLGKGERRTTEYLSDLYDRQPSEVKRERGELENFLFRHGLSAEGVRRIIRDEVWERERYARQHPPPPPPPHMARYPLLGDDGRQVKDADGPPVDRAAGGPQHEYAGVPAPGALQGAPTPHSAPGPGETGTADKGAGAPGDRG